VDRRIKVKKKLLFASVFLGIVFMANSAFADTWGQGGEGDGWRSFISWEAWWDFIHNLWLP
jgi:hypothetical protein